MEFGSDKNSQGFRPGVTMAEDPKEQRGHSAAIAPAPEDTCGEVDMETCVTADEVQHAGGFGVTDNINSIVPVASDSTVFEDHLQKIQSYEDSEDNKAQGQTDCPSDIIKVSEVNGGTAGNANEHGAPSSEAAGREACVNSDDVIRAGGFGATDDISSFLPVASDFTDFEAYLRDARDYEDLKEEIARPGLGWTSEMK